MKVIVDEMPLCEYDCPFSSEYETRRSMKYECAVTKGWCDLKCGACSGLKVLKRED